MKKILFLLFLLTNFLFASIGQITALVGEIKISRDSNVFLAKLGEELEKNDVINSAKGSKTQITMNDNTIITIGENSILNIFDYVYDENKPKGSKASFGFMEGSFKSITGKIGKVNKERFKLKTKSASIGIRGTTIVGNQKMIACTDGAISVTANGVSVFVEKQQFTLTLKGEAPTPAKTLTHNILNILEKESNGEDTLRKQEEKKKGDKQSNNENQASVIKQKNPKKGIKSQKIDSVRYENTSVYKNKINKKNNFNPDSMSLSKEYNIGNNVRKDLVQKVNNSKTKIVKIKESNSNNSNYSSSNFKLGHKNNGNNGKHGG